MLDIHGLLFASDLAMAMWDVDELELAMENGNDGWAEKVAVWAKDEIVAIELKDRLIILNAIESRISESPRRGALRELFGLASRKPDGKYTTMPKRKTSETTEDAVWFCKEILGRDFNWTTDKRYLREAKLLRNPPQGQGIARDVVRGTLLALKNGQLDSNLDEGITTMWTITYGNPPYYQQYLAWAEQPPPHYLVAEVEMWERITGKTAYPESEAGGTITSPEVPNFS